MEAGFSEAAAVFGGGIRGCLGSSSSTWTLGGTLPATKMPRQRDLLRALVTLMKTLAAAYGIVVATNSFRTEKCVPRGRSASKIYAPDPQTEWPSPPISQLN